ncbi:MAG: CPBP family intramembrane glutamic endopeptidase [Bacteroidota bacterium]|nr:CPBP family intramembrane glutamic endopeptidase [Bacteroidota bacterium]
MTNDPSVPRPLAPAHSFSIFLAFSVLLYAQTHLTIPWLADATGIEPVFFWFVVGGLGVFLPLLLTALFLLRREGELTTGLWSGRLRFRRMNGGDWLWSVGGIVAAGAASALVMQAVTMAGGEMETQPPFMHLEPLDSGRYWLLAVWLPYWVLNIMGEEILWRGVMLPRSEAASGKWAWVVQGAGWTIFHVAFGWQLLLTMLPLLFILPYVAQRRANSWTGVVIHAVINGPAFVLIALGVI